MAYSEINLGTTANDGTGDDARTAGGKINNNFKQLFGQFFMLDGWRVTRDIVDVNDLDLDTFKDNDMVCRWTDTGTKDRWVEGIILDADGIDLPDDVDDPAKFFITNQKIKST
jgi:hypothetical protein